ncbi:hypothetical protein BH24ACT5_BH24ACT5_26920 [soil metagenome]
MVRTSKRLEAPRTGEGLHPKPTRPAMRKRVVRRLAALVMVLSGVIGPAFATPARAADDVASVNGRSISVDDLDALIESYADHPELTNFAVDESTGTVSMDNARTALSFLITQALGDDFLESVGADPITDDEAESALVAQGESSPGFLTLDGVGRSVIASQIAASQRIGDIDTPQVADLADRYEASPASLGVICARAIPVPDEATGDEVLDALGDGTDFATLRDQYAPASDVTDDSAVSEPASSDGSATTDESVSSSSDATCSSLFELRVFGPEFVTAVLGAQPGVPFGPVETPGGLQVLEIPRLDEVDDQIQGIYDSPPQLSSSGPTAAGELLFDGFRATADVTISPRYGRWDSLTGQVVALSA